MPYKDPNSEAALASKRRRWKKANEKRKEWTLQHPRAKRVPEEVQREQNRLRKNRVYRNSPEVRAAALSSSLKSRFGVTLDQRDAKIKFQGGLCTLCGRPLDQEGLGGPALDHNHETSALRDVIHRTCNAAIGLLNDDPVLLDKAAAYLRRFQ